MAESKRQIRVTLVRGLAGKPEAHIKAVHSLGLKKVGQSKILEDLPQVRGNIAKASYMLSVEELGDETT